MKRIFLLCFSSLAVLASDAVLPGTKPLNPHPDLSAEMVGQVDAFLLKEIESAKNRRDFAKRTLAENRTLLARQIGVVEQRVPPSLERSGDLEKGGLLLETDRARVLRVRWKVLDGLNSEGLLITPKSNPLGRVIYTPDADVSPEKLAGLQNGSNDNSLLNCGFEVLIPALINRESTHSGSDIFAVKTNIPHREWIYRQSFVQGRHIIGLEVQKLLAAVDWFASKQDGLPLIMAGAGEGGLLALHAGALDDRIASVYVAGSFGPRERAWEEPIYRNVQGLLRDFGDAELAAMIAPRPLAIHQWAYPSAGVPSIPVQGVRSIAAPGKLPHPTDSEVKSEAARACDLAQKTDWLKVFDATSDNTDIVSLLASKEAAVEFSKRLAEARPASIPTADFSMENAERQQRLVAEMSAWCQKQLSQGERNRENEFWKKRPGTLAEYNDWSKTQRDRFWKEVIGDLPWPDVPINPRSRLIRETDKVAVYEVVLDVWTDVFAWGWLALPKDIKPGEQRPVIVCQHGLEGVPEDCLNDDPNSKAWKPYKAFALKLAEEGFVTFSPHNLYRGGDAFRGLQRKLNLLGKSLFSVIIPQHARIIEWLKTQSWADSDRIAFYGLSYGGKSAMRIPAVLEDYCLSICSGDFNEWVRKCASTDMRMSYVFTHEYEIWEWNLGGTFNYAEMAALIAPRPFMVERGHDDGVGTDEWVNYEYAKIRRLYEKLGIIDRTTIEHFNDGHTIHGVGSFEFLRRHLKR